MQSKAIQNLENNEKKTSKSYFKEIENVQQIKTTVPCTLSYTCVVESAQEKWSNDENQTHTQIQLWTLHKNMQS